MVVDVKKARLNGVVRPKDGNQHAKAPRGEEET